jgi:hypothetical protein
MKWYQDGSGYVLCENCHEEVMKYGTVIRICEERNCMITYLPDSKWVLLK